MRNLIVSILACVALMSCTGKPLSPIDPNEGRPEVSGKWERPIIARDFTALETLDIGSNGDYKEVVSIRDSSHPLYNETDIYSTVVGSWRFVPSDSSAVCNSWEWCVRFTKTDRFYYAALHDSDGGHYLSRRDMGPNIEDLHVIREGSVLKLGKKDYLLSE